jgi:hypothetical protein
VLYGSRDFVAGGEGRNKKGSERERKKVQFDLNDFGFGKCKRVNSDWRSNGF